MHNITTKNARVMIRSNLCIFCAATGYLNRRPRGHDVYIAIARNLSDHQRESSRDLVQDIESGQPMSQLISALIDLTLTTLKVKSGFKKAVTNTDIPTVLFTTGIKSARDLRLVQDISQPSHLLCFKT